MQKKLLITGAGGFVAGSVLTHAGKVWAVYAIDRIQFSDAPGNIHYHNLDLLDQNNLTKLFHQINPAAVIHTAALADIDFCQNNPALAGQINVGITQSLADLCAATGAKLILCSTDSVFDGRKGNYTETDLPNPVNFYAETKVKAEAIVSALPNGVVARLALVLGLPVLGSGNSFLAKTIDKLKRGEPVNFPENEIRTPIDIITLGKSLVELAGNDFTGTVHLAGNTRINRFEMARQIAEKSGYSKELIVAVNSNALAGRASRPNDASLDNRLAQKILNTPMRSLLEGLDLTLNFKPEF